MFVELLSIVTLVGGLIREKTEQNKPYCGTKGDVFKDNPNFIESRNKANEIYDKYRKEYEQSTVKKSNW